MKHPTNSSSSPCRHLLLLLTFALPSSLTMVSSFSPILQYVTPRTSFSIRSTSAGNAATQIKMSTTTDSGGSSDNDDDDMGFLTSTTRRDMLFTLSSVSLFLGISSSSSPSFAEESGGIGTDPNHPIAVIGAGGKCGTLCTKILASKNRYVRAITRNARTVLSSESQYVTNGAGDVTSLSSLTEALKGCSGVIFTASASKKGGDAAHVDYLGIANTAKACVENKVPRMVAISSLAVTRPDSIGFKVTNIFGRIMDYKVAGEQQVRSIYSNAPSSCTYTLIRPGGLSDAPSEGPSSLKVGQADLYGGEISRTDVSQLCVAALLKRGGGSGVDNTTFEVFNKKGYSKSVKTLPSEDTLKLLLRGGETTYEGLLEGLFSDEELRERFGGVLSDYRGTKVESLDSLV